MKKYLLILFLISSCSTKSDKAKNAQLETTKVAEHLKPRIISDSTNTLTGKTESLELEYLAWGCACANWVTPTDWDKYHDDKLASHCIFIEPANDTLDLPLYFDPTRYKIKVQGQFYMRPDYPKGTEEGEEQLEKAKVFRYTKMEVMKKDIKYPAKDDTTINLTYNAIDCTCAQWSYTSSTSDAGKREYVYLEPANNKLINADKLFNGLNLPLEIQLTGQIVSSAGYPKGYNPKKGSPEPGTVFRYTKIKVINKGQIKIVTKLPHP